MDDSLLLWLIIHSTLAGYLVHSNVGLDPPLIYIGILLVMHSHHNIHKGSYWELLPCFFGHAQSWLKTIPVHCLMLELGHVQYLWPTHAFFQLPCRMHQNLHTQNVNGQSPHSNGEPTLTASILKNVLTPKCRCSAGLVIEHQFCGHLPQIVGANLRIINNLMYIKMKQSPYFLEFFGIFVFACFLYLGGGGAWGREYEGSIALKYSHPSNKTS